MMAEHEGNCSKALSAVSAWTDVLTDRPHLSNDISHGIFPWSKMLATQALGVGKSVASECVCIITF